MNSLINSVNNYEGIFLRYMLWCSIATSQDMHILQVFCQTIGKVIVLTTLQSELFKTLLTTTSIKLSNDLKFCTLTIFFIVYCSFRMSFLSNSSFVFYWNIQGCFYMLNTNLLVIPTEKNSVHTDHSTRIVMNRYKTTF